MSNTPPNAHDQHDPHSPPAALLKDIATTAATIAATDPASAGPHWGAMHKLLLKAKVEPAKIGQLVASRDTAGLSLLVRQLHGDDTAVADVAASPKGPAIDPDVLRHALRAFRNRLKFSRLDAESRLGVGPMTGGKKHGIDAIIPPREVPIAVWEALADEGKLRRAGPGFYALPDEAE